MTKYDETWKAVVSFEGCYEVSNKGRVKSLNYNKTGEAAIMSLRGSSTGYWVITLWKDRRPSYHNVHRLVMEAFIGECPPGHQVAHLNGNRDDCRLENLRYVTPKENHSHKLVHGTLLHGEGHPSAILNNAQVIDIRRRIGSGEVQKHLAEEYGVAVSTINSIKQGRSWKHD